MENLLTDIGAGAPPADNRPLRRMRLFNFFTRLKRRNLDLGEIDAGKPALQATAPAAGADPKSQSPQRFPSAPKRFRPLPEITTVTFSPTLMEDHWRELYQICDSGAIACYHPAKAFSVEARMVEFGAERL